MKRQKNIRTMRAILSATMATVSNNYILSIDVALFDMIILSRIPVAVVLEVSMLGNSEK